MPHSRKLLAWCLTILGLSFWGTSVHKCWASPLSSGHLFSLISSSSHILLNSFIAETMRYEIHRNYFSLLFTLKNPLGVHCLLTSTTWHVGEQKSHDTEVKIHNLQCIWCASLTYIREILSSSLKSFFCRSLTLFLRVPRSLCQSGLGFLSIQCYFFSQFSKLSIFQDLAFKLLKSLICISNCIWMLV